MIQSNELRVGNDITMNGQIITVSFSTFLNVERFPERYEPILLTEEWLSKFGFYFVIAINNRYLKDYGAFYFTIMIMNDDKSYQVSLSNHEKREGESISVVGLGIIKYVHQLQNLYFALTNEELK